MAQIRANWKDIRIKEISDMNDDYKILMIKLRIEKMKVSVAA